MIRRGRRRGRGRRGRRGGGGRRRRGRGKGSLKNGFSIKGSHSKKKEAKRTQKRSTAKQDRN